MRDIRAPLARSFEAQFLTLVGIHALLALLALGCGGGSRNGAASGTELFVVVSPHPDDETIMAGGLLSRAAHEPNALVEGIYLTSGDAAGLPGPCFEKSEEEKKQKIVALREEETRSAWRALGADPYRIHFLRYPDTRLVESSSFSGGHRVDVRAEAGEAAVAEVRDLLPSLIAKGVKRVTVITGSKWDAHPDHRTAYAAARAGAEALRGSESLPVTILSTIVHDEVPWQAPFCCFGDFHWPNPGPELDHSALADFPARPRPPEWDVRNQLGSLTAVRMEALREHKSQIDGYLPLCMVLLNKSYYQIWMDKTEEAFYREEL